MKKDFMQVCEGSLMENDLLPAEEILILEQVALTQSDSTKAQSWRSLQPRRSSRYWPYDEWPRDDQPVFMASDLPELQLPVDSY